MGKSPLTSWRSSTVLVLYPMGRMRPHSTMVVMMIAARDAGMAFPRTGTRGKNA